MKIIALFLVVSMFTGCATMRRHPVVTGLVAGAAVGITVGILTHQKTCPQKTYDGSPYQGTPPCPVEEKGSFRHK
jgi:hypothetical protein